MMDTSIAINGKRRNQMLAVAWIGAFLGCTLSMAEGAEFLIFHQHAEYAIVPIGCFAISTFVLLGIWSYRDLMCPKIAISATVVILALFAVSLWTIAAVKESNDSLRNLPWPASSFLTTFISLLVPMTMIGLLMNFHGTRPIRNVYTRRSQPGAT